MDDIESITFFGIFVSVVFSFLVSMADSFLKGLDKNQVIEVAEAGGDKYETLYTLLSQPQKYHVALALLKWLSIVSALALSFPLLISLPKIVPPIVIILVFVLLVEVVPRNYSYPINTNALIKLLYILQPVCWLLFPIILPMTYLSRFLIRLLGGKNITIDSIVSPELLETFVSVGNRQGDFDVEEHEMISRILGLPDKVVREIMIPRTDIVHLEAKSGIDEILRVAIQSRHSRIPVYLDRVDHSHNIIGILHVKELLDCWSRGKTVDLEQLVSSRPPYFTPESRKIWDLFQDLQSNRLHLAIIVDEYGGTAGLVTLEDIIEEIVGEIQDEYDTEEQVECFQISSDIYSVDARMNIDDFNVFFNSNLEVVSVDTIGGVMIDHFGRVPEKGASFQIDRLKLSVLEADNRRIYRVTVDQKISNGTNLTKSNEEFYD